MPFVPLTWLGELVDVDPGSTAEDVAAALVKVGLEEECVHGSGVVGPLVVGRVLSAEKETHKNGKSILYCRVDVGAVLNDPAEGDTTRRAAALSAERTTSVRATSWPSRSREPCCPGTSRSRLARPTVMCPTG